MLYQLMLGYASLWQVSSGDVMLSLVKTG